MRIYDVIMRVFNAGNWKTFRAQQGSTPEASGRVGETAPNPSASSVPLNAVSSKGLPCPLAGKQASRNTQCPLTKRKYKQCCGKDVCLHKFIL